MNDEKLTNCIACKHKIRADATVCKECNSSQNSFKNHVQYYAHIAGITAIVLSLISFTISNWPRVLEVVSPFDEIKVINFNSGYGVLISNQGNRSVFISHVTTETMSGEFKQNYSINKEMKSRQIALLVNNEFDFISSEHWRYVYGVSKSFTNDLKDIYLSNFNNKVDVKNFCVLVNYVSKNHPVLEMIRKHANGDMNLIPTKSSLIYLAGTGKNKKSQNLGDIVGVYMQKDSKGCKEKYPQLYASSKGA